MSSYPIDPVTSGKTLDSTLRYQLLVLLGVFLWADVSVEGIVVGFFCRVSLKPLFWNLWSVWREAIVGKAWEMLMCKKKTKHVFAVDCRTNPMKETWTACGITVHTYGSPSLTHTWHVCVCKNTYLNCYLRELFIAMHWIAQSICTSTLNTCHIAINMSLKTIMCAWQCVLMCIYIHVYTHICISCI